MPNRSRSLVAGQCLRFFGIACSSDQQAKSPTGGAAGAVSGSAPVGAAAGLGGSVGCPPGQTQCPDGCATLAADEAIRVDGR